MFYICLLFIQENTSIRPQPKNDNAPLITNENHKGSVDKLHAVHTTAVSRSKNFINYDLPPKYQPRGSEQLEPDFSVEMNTLPSDKKESNSKKARNNNLSADHSTFARKRVTTDRPPKMLDNRQDESNVSQIVNSSSNQRINKLQNSDKKDNAETKHDSENEVDDTEYGIENNLFGSDIYTDMKTNKTVLSNEEAFDKKNKTKETSTPTAELLLGLEIFENNSSIGKKSLELTFIFSI